MIQIKDVIPNFSELYFEDFQNESHPSSYSIESGYEVLIIRRIKLDKEGVELQSVGYVIQRNDIYKYYRDQKGFIKLENGFDTLYAQLDQSYKKNHTIVKSYVEEIDKLEDNLYDRKISKIFMDVWFDIKKDLSTAERFYLRSIQVVSEFVKVKSRDEGILITEYQDLVDLMNETFSTVLNQLNRLDSLHHYYSSLKNDRLNNNIYFLTIISAIFLPLNLIVGFFGINTGDLYFKDSIGGTHYVLIILALSLIASLLFFPVVKFIDNYIVKFFLSKNHFHNQFQKIFGTRKK